MEEELSQDTGQIPIIRLYDSLIVPIQVALTDRLLHRLQQDVSRMVVERRVESLIVDLTGVELLDSYLARGLRDLGLMVRLMGVSTVICGLHPGMAVTLVEMGMDMPGVQLALNLERALEALSSSKAGDPTSSDEG